ncbi:putative Ig domain-containing protein, partial [Chitinophaga sp. 22321]|uniref:putative Ig domain-containing protein n=1 Tax=Chitinophaga sp. 22321 TaxID=3453909 RepID=UPI003F827D51
AIQLPAFATLLSQNDTCRITVQPGYADAGSYTVKVQAKDNQGGIDVRSFVLTVVDKPTPNYKLYLNFKLNNNAPAPWNNIFGTTTTGLKDENGQLTTAGLTFDESWWAAGTEGANTGNNSGVYPDVVMSEYMYFGSLPGFFSGAPAMHGHLTGLETNRTYSIKFFSSSKWWAPQPDNGSTKFTINGVSQTLYVQNNTTNVVTFSNITPNANGEILFTLSIPAGGQVGYLNAMEINAGTSQVPPNNHAPIITDISNQSLDAGTSMNIPVTATDADGNQITYSTLNLPSFVTLTQSGGTVSLAVAPGTNNAGTYNNISVIATDSYGAADTTTFNLTVNPPPNSGGSYRVLMNFRLNADAPAPWNNIDGNNTVNLKNDQGLATGIGLRFDESWWAAGVEGATTGNNSGVYPDVVLSQYLYFGSLPGFFSGAPAMHGHITGLSANTTYTLKFMSDSKWWAPQPDNGSTQFTVNGVSKSLYAQNNTTNTADFINLTADANGEITFTASIPAGGQVGYINAMELIATTAAPGNLANNNMAMNINTAASLNNNNMALKGSFQVSAYPNPFTDNLAIDLTLQKPAPGLLIEISDMTGKVLYNETRKGVPEGKNTIRVNTQRYVGTTGFYILKVTSTTGETKSVKLLKRQ